MDSIEKQLTNNIEKLQLKLKIKIKEIESLKYKVNRLEKQLLMQEQANDKLVQTILEHSKDYQLNYHISGELPINLL